MSEPPRPRGHVPVWLGLLWTMPNTLIGMVVGLLTFQMPRLDGAIIFDRTPRGVTKLMLRFHRTAMTMGFVIVGALPVEGQLSAHERHHLKQYCVLGPFFLPVYFGLAIPYGYRRHPLEISARRAAGEIAGEQP